jgi:hypothetical protein
VFLSALSVLAQSARFSFFILILILILDYRHKQVKVKAVTRVHHSKFFEKVESIEHVMNQQSSRYRPTVKL